MRLKSGASRRHKLPVAIRTSKRLATTRRAVDPMLKAERRLPQEHTASPRRGKYQHINMGTTPVPPVTHVYCPGWLPEEGAHGSRGLARVH